MSGMNYVGSISILDRGDGPAQAVMDRNARSLAQRMADETRDELNKVMSRVHTIYGAMETTDDYPTTSNMEYLNDLAELEAILKDEIKKRQYQQQVTVFIVGYQDVCHQKLRLLQQVNEFFMENCKQIDEEDWFPTTPDMDLEEVSNTVEDSLNHAHELTTKLAVLNREMVDYMANLAEKKASNKGKKKIEKALQQAKDEVSGLSEKLLTLQTELDDREEKVANLFKQMDSKNLELQKYRTAAELGKKATEDMEEVRKQLMMKDAKIVSQRQQLSKMEVELAQSNHLKDRSEIKFSASDGESQQKIIILQKELDEQKKTNDEIKSDMTKLLDNQIHALHESHQQELNELKKQHKTNSDALQEEIEQYKEDLTQYQHDLITLQIEKGDTETPSEVARIVDLDSDASHQTSRQSSKQSEEMRPDLAATILISESRPSTKDTKVSGKSAPGKSGKGSRSPTRQSRDGKSLSRTSGARSDALEDVVVGDLSDDDDVEMNIGDGKEYAEVAIQDEGGDPSSAQIDEKSRTPNTRHSKRALSTLAPVLESDFDSAFDLFDDDSWAAVPNDQTSGRFAQYRRLTTYRLSELEEQLQLTNAKTKRKVNTLKAQFQEHKSKWEAERRVLIEQVEQSLQLQTDAEKEADAAMTQLEDFITEQERLEEEEEVKRTEVLSTSLTPQDGVTPLQGSLVASPTQQVVLTPESEQELQRLMQQTDDAKSARQGLPSSTSTRTTSSGSIQVGTLLDVTKPITEKQPSPDIASTAAPTPVNAEENGATAAGSPTKSQGHKQSPSPQSREEVRIVSAADEVSCEVLNEVGLTIDPQSGHVAVLKSPEQAHASESLVAIQSPTHVEADNRIDSDKIEGATQKIVGGTEEKQVLPPSGQPLPPRSVSGSAGKTRDLRKNPVILIVSGSGKGKGEASEESAAAGADGGMSSSSSAQALIPGGTDLGKASDLDIEIIALPKAALPVAITTPRGDGVPAPLTPSREGSFVDKIQLVASGQRSQAADATTPMTSVTPASKQPTALDVLGLMNPNPDSQGQTTPQMTPRQTSTAGFVSRSATTEIVPQPAIPGRQDSTLSQSKLKEADTDGQTPRDAGTESSAIQAPTVALDGISLDLATPRDSTQVQELNARLGTCASAPPMVSTDKNATQPAVEEIQRSKTAGVISPLAEGVTLQLSAVEQALSKSDTPLALKITNKMTGETEIRDIVQGTVAHLEGPSKSGTATTFMTPDGQILVTAPTDITTVSAQGLVPIEVQGDSQAVSRINTALTLNQESRSPTVASLKMMRSPIDSPTKLISFGSGGGIGGDPLPSPRSSRLRRSKTTELAVLLESNLGPSQESAIEMVKKMMIDEENLKPKQQKALNSMRAAVKAVEARDALSDEEIARTLTLLALASQMSHEAFQLGVRPDSIFRSFSQMNPKSLSQLVPERPKSSPGRAAPSSSGFEERRELTKDLITRETTLESVQEVDNESTEDFQKQDAEVDLSQLKELPLLDIVDTLPTADFVKPTSGIILPSEATQGSSMQDSLETPLADLLEDDPIKMLKQQQQREKTNSEGELMDDGSNMERGRTHISEREATQAESESHHNADGGQYEGSEQHQSFSTTSKQVSRTATDLASLQALGPNSKQPSELSMGGGTQRSLIRKSISSLEGMKIEGATEEEIRSSSSLSRASLRNAYKTRLEETKSAAEDRRSKSPHISLPTQLTVDDELILDEDDDDDEFTDDMFKDPSMYEIGTSPPPPGLPSRDQTGMSSKHDGFRKGFKGVLPRDGSDPGKDPTQPVIQKIIKQGHRLLQHPVLKEYLTTYEGVVSFKDSMSKMFLDKDMMSAHQMTSDLEMLTFDSNQKAMPQVEELTKNVCHVLQEISTLISSILVYDREPPVSSLHLMSREATQKSFVPPTETISEQPRAPPATRNEDIHSAASSRNGSQKSGRMSVSSDKVHIKELQIQYNELKTQLDKDSSQHQDQLQRNTVVMMEMQDTINDLHRELSALGKKATRVKSASSVQGEAAAHKSPSPETSVMFTRLDSERNAKIMKKAVVEEKLDQDRYKEAVARMDEYVSLPAQRLAHLVKKYVHHRRMRDIEEKVKKSSSLDEEVFNALDKMENLQNQRARQWAASMDEMGIERLKLANLLMNTLENIEQESGIFLIKPMYSYRGRNIKPGAQSKLSRPLRSQHRNPTPSNIDAASSFIPAPTPASNYRLVRHERHYLQQMQQQQNSTLSELRPAEAKLTKEEGNDVKVMGSGMTFTMGSPRTTWNMQASQPFTGKEDPNSFNTPRILELDINRMLIGQNNISSKIPFPPTDDRLVNASQNSLRSYVTVNRPTASLGGEKTEKRPGSGRESSSRSSSKRVTVSETDKDIPTTLPSASPLPPITPIPGEEPEDLDEEEEEEEEEEYVGERKDDGVRPPSVAFTNEDEEDEGEDGEDDNAREPPQSPPGSSMYQSTLRNEDSESAIKHTRASSRLTLSDDEN